AWQRGEDVRVQEPVPCCAALLKVGIPRLELLAREAKSIEHLGVFVSQYFADEVAQARGERRSNSGSGHRDHKIASAENRRNDEIGARRVVHGAAEYPAGLRFLEDLLLELRPARGGHDDPNIVQIRACE